jgi:fatty-acyl-CoA synthase
MVVTHLSPWQRSVLAELKAVPAAAKGTLPWFVRMLTGRTQSLLDMVAHHAERDPHGLALEMDDVRMSWQSLVQTTSRIAHVLAGSGVKQGDVVALMGTNSPFYVAAILGISRLGATAALVNHHLEGRPLAHALSTSKARVGLFERRFRERVDGLAEIDASLPTRWIYAETGDRAARASSGDAGHPNAEVDFDAAMNRAPFWTFPAAKVHRDDDFVYIYTSGTTGLPKPCRISHSRALMAGAAFGAVMFEFEPGDKLYCALPLYHASALLLGAGACLATGTPMAIRESFSARAFWPDVKRYGATAMIYIGELCRYLLGAPPSPDERGHRLRVAVGNGMRPDVWTPFQERFGIEKIREFYAATEAPGFLVNLSGRVGSVGRMPLAGMGWLSIVKYDVDQDAHVRGAGGFCVECGPDEPGELLVRLPKLLQVGAFEFRGYTDADATKKKVLTDVFEPGDRYFRSGDLLRRDADGFYYFVDRIGDTYRCKGENVSTAEVADVLSRAAGVVEVTVVGVQIPAIEGQFGLAAVVVEGDLDVEAFQEVAKELPSYAKPRFVRVLGELEKTGTFKVQKGTLKKEGADPARVRDRLYVWDTTRYVPLTEAIYEEIIAGTRRL